MISTDMPHDGTQNLPPEIITEIFTLICGGTVLLPPPDHRYPWILGYVSSRWRHILWTSPSIWNSITIGHQDAHIPTDSVAGYPDLYMERYSISDILTYILANIPGPMSLVVADEAYVRNVMGTIMEHITRFSTLAINGLPQKAFSALLELPPIAFARLETLLLTDVCVYGRPLESYISPFESAPHLRSVVLEVWTPKYMPSLLLLPWATMEDISVECMPMPPAAMFDILRASPLLKTCSFYVDVMEPMSTLCTLRITALALTTLKLEANGPSTWADILSPLVTPSLKSLTIWSSRIPTAPLISLVTRSRCAVTHLDLSEHEAQTGDVNTDDVDIDLLSQHFPAMTHLYLVRPVPPSVFAKLQDRAVFPKLLDSRLRVRPDGFCAFLNMLDTYGDTHADSSQRCYEIMSHPGPGFVEQRDRYLARYEVYNAIEGLSVTIIDACDDYTTMRPDDDELIPSSAPPGCGASVGVGKSEGFGVGIG